ncbi:13388_t:CDS:1, partial [Entrophospora sp. SA101]
KLIGLIAYHDKDFGLNFPARNTGSIYRINKDLKGFKWVDLGQEKPKK